VRLAEYKVVVSAGGSVVVEMVRPVETVSENVAVVDWGVGAVESVAATVSE
jgi:hypothetical protein